MKDLDVMIRSVNERMDHLELLRERSVSISREVIRMTKRAIHAIHSREAHEDILSDAISAYSKLYGIIDEEPEILFSGPAADAMMELSEACILSSVVLGKEMPSYSSLGVTPQAWVLGLADCLGELRRIMLDSLMNRDFNAARDTFDKMEVICEAVMSFDVPDAILPIRRKQDVARSIMERTRTDITNALLMNR
ncbi:MAG: RNA-binding protein [Methanomassiliicoccaceae archaeon]|nr:RNA-binding protein [Methanomassiliicoccaceae archaeon]